MVAGHHLFYSLLSSTPPCLDGQTVFLFKKKKKKKSCPNGEHKHVIHYSLECQKKLLHNSLSLRSRITLISSIWTLQHQPPFLSQMLTLDFSGAVFCMTDYINHLLWNKENLEEGEELISQCKSEIKGTGCEVTWVKGVPLFSSTSLCDGLSAGQLY